MTNIKTLTDSQLADTTEFKRFFDSYLETALWSSVDGMGLPLDENYGPEDIASEALTECEATCIDFYRLAVAATEAHSGDFEFNPGMYGHDFWLTHCGHGAGFWDGDYPEDLGNILADIANTYDSVDMYACGDGQVYL